MAHKNLLTKLIKIRTKSIQKHININKFIVNKFKMLIELILKKFLKKKDFENKTLFSRLIIKLKIISRFKEAWDMAENNYHILLYRSSTV
ncbi:hypothetical protein BpHYR1_006852 [Brachionus plicatilis]|uniref:Uncharacterized protein n=1 Tax=Brachionus plicatilis TaxID=10195 RepID=A0A3M7P9C2_BRAPC|nr:hypothetical protein BpHYR1_006852 [Brachionus plicatilis]